jgi:hypothetical protein
MNGRNLKIIRKINLALASYFLTFKDLEAKKKELAITLFFQTATSRGQTSGHPLHGHQTIYLSLPTLISTVHQTLC